MSTKREARNLLLLTPDQKEDQKYNKENYPTNNTPSHSSNYSLWKTIGTSWLISWLCAIRSGGGLFARVGVRVAVAPGALQQARWRLTISKVRKAGREAFPVLCALITISPDSVNVIVWRQGTPWLFINIRIVEFVSAFAFHVPCFLFSMKERKKKAKDTWSLPWVTMQPVWLTPSKMKKKRKRNNGRLFWE